MRVLHGIEGLQQLPPGMVMSIGNFDGVHRGHQALLRRALDLKDAENAPGVAVVTFEPHPLTHLRPQAVPPRLTTPQLKRELLEACGVEILVVLPPTADVLDLTAEQFWRIIRDEARPSNLVEGDSFTFGKGRGGNIERLRQWSAQSAVRLHVLEPVSVALVDLLIVSVSSSIIRWLLINGRVRDGAICLGRPYALHGNIVRGAGRGKSLGIPTANLACEGQLIPGDGVYAGRCAVDGRPWPTAVSIGTNPTFGANPRSVEAQLIGFDGDLYGKTLNLELLDWQRDQWDFRGVEPLKAQVARDVRETIARQKDDPARPPVAAPA